MKITLLQGDLTALAVDAIVNAANPYLQLGSGVSGAIRRKGGPTIQRQCDAYIKAYGALAEGEAVVTGAGSLPCRFVIHVAGPRQGEAQLEPRLARAVLAVIELANSFEFKTLALPAISSGNFGVPVAIVAEVLLRTLNEVAEKPSTLQEVQVVLWDEATLRVFKAAEAALLPV